MLRARFSLVLPVATLREIGALEYSECNRPWVCPASAAARWLRKIKTAGMHEEYRCLGSTASVIVPLSTDANCVLAQMFTFGADLPGQWTLVRAGDDGVLAESVFLFALPRANFPRKAELLGYRDAAFLANIVPPIKASIAGSGSSAVIVIPDDGDVDMFMLFSESMLPR